MSSTATVSAPAPPTTSLRDRVKAAIHLLDCAALYGEVFGLNRVRDEYNAAAEQLLEATS